MTVKIGYLLPTREYVMEGRSESLSLLDLAERAETMNLDSVWIGDSLLAKPRHEPLTVLAAIAGRTKKISMGTAVLLPILRNPVLSAHQLATLDQISAGRLIVGIGAGQDIPPVRAEFEAVGVPFEKRIGRLMEGVRLWKALWSGNAVNWEGRWKLQDAVLGPVPHTPGGPPIWGVGNVPAALKRTAVNFEGWFPVGPSDSVVWGEQWSQVRSFATEAGKNPDSLTGAIYLTLSIDDDTTKANDRLNRYLENYYKLPAEKLRLAQGCYAGSLAGAEEWLEGYVEKGATHLSLRFPGDHERNMEIAASLRLKLQ